ncbi:CocE/NonD family hydrolase, partial [Salmonella enterica subsp. enterica serovar Typhimurium]|nr:CocE/NonD family hydrolase [Salmonella enterica subsp. enterica serovar Typhimurium]
MDQASLEHMPAPLKQAYLDVNPDPKGLQTMHDRDARRMQNFRDIPSEQIRAIQAPVLVVNGDQDVILPEHALELYRELPHARL